MFEEKRKGTNKFQASANSKDIVVAQSFPESNLGNVKTGACLFKISFK